MPVNGPQTPAGEYNPPVASPQAPVKQSPSASFLGALRPGAATLLEAAKGNGNWINPSAVTKDMTGIGNRQEILERNERLAKARTLLSDIPRGPVLARADSEPALGMPNSRSSWPVQAVKDMFASIKRIGDHVYAPFTGQESPYDSMDEMIEDTTMLSGDFTGAGVASRIGTPMQKGVTSIFGTRGIDDRLLSRAQEMKIAGKTDQEVWKDTGLWQKDGRWLVETPTNNLQFKEGVIEPSRKKDGKPFQQKTRQQLGEMIDAPELFDKYPELVDLGISFRPDKRRHGAAYLSEDLINMKGQGKEDLRQILIHELQHFIQYYDSLPNGTNPEAAFRGWSKANPKSKFYPGDQEAYMRNSGEVQARLAEQRSNLTPEEARNIPPMYSEKSRIAAGHGGNSHKLQEDRPPASQWPGEVTQLDPFSVEGGNMESVLSNRLNEITQKLEKHQGTYKERLALMDEKKDIQGNLMLAIKQREAGKGLRGRYSASTGDGEMYDRNMPLSRVQSEIKMIKQFAKDTKLEELTIDDIAQHVYGSTEPWAKARINAALKAADKEKARTLATPPTEMPPMSPLSPNIADSSTSIFARGANDNSLAALEDDIVGRPMNDAERQDWQRNILQEQLDRDHFQESINDLKAAINQEKKAERPDIFKISHFNKRIAELEKQKAQFNTEWANDPPPFEGEVDRSLYGTEDFDVNVQPLIDNYMGVVYTPEELPLVMARYKKDGMTNTHLFDVIDEFEIGGTKAIKRIIDLFESSENLEKVDKAVLKFAKDLYNKVKDTYE